VQELRGRKESLHALAFAADNRFLVVGGTACRVDVWDLANPTARRPMFSRQVHTVAHLWISPDGREFIAAELTDGAVSRYQLDNPAARKDFTPSLTSNTLAPPRILPDGSGVVCGRTPTRWNFAAGSEPVWQATNRRRSGHDAIAYAVARDCVQLAVGELTSLTATYRVRVYLMGTDDPPQELGVVSNHIKRLAWSPGGEYLAAAVDTRVFVWKSDGQLLTQFRIAGRKHVMDVAFHPSGRYLAVADNAGTIRLLETDAWTESRVFAWGLPKARCIAFSPDGALAAAGSENGKVILWDVDL